MYYKVLFEQSETFQDSSVLNKKLAYLFVSTIIIICFARTQIIIIYDSYYFNNIKNNNNSEYLIIILMSCGYYLQF